MPLVDTTNLNVFKVGNDLPSKTRQVATVSLSIGQTNSPQVIDLRRQVQGRNLTNIQGVYIDNSKSFYILLISTPCGETISIPPKSFATMPLFLADDAEITVNAVFINPAVTGVDTKVPVSITLCNFPLDAAVWEGSPSSAYILGDQDLPFNPNTAMLANYQAISFASGTYTGAAIFGSPNWFLNKFVLNTAGFFSTKPGNMIFQLSDSLVPRIFYQGYFYVEPLTAAGSALSVSRQILEYDFGVTYGQGDVGLSSNVVVTIVASPGLAIGPFTGQLDLTIIGGATSQTAV